MMHVDAGGNMRLLYVCIVAPRNLSTRFYLVVSEAMPASVKARLLHAVQGCIIGAS
jgi:hypothetical protein